MIQKWKAAIALMGTMVFYAHGQSATHNEEHAASQAPPIRTSYYLETTLPRLDLVLPEPPSQDSPTTAAELAELHGLETSRTAVEIASAQADDHDKDIFIFKTVLGSGFTANAFPITAVLSEHVRRESAAAGDSLKSMYRRPRPYQMDKTLHPVCPVSAGPTSYPSGHSLSGYLLALTLVQLVPERRDQILARADQYAHDRLVCGVHYASDTEASRRLAYTIFGALLVTPQFQRDLSAARAEVRPKLSLP